MPGVGGGSQREGSQGKVQKGQRNSFFFEWDCGSSKPFGQGPGDPT